MDIALISEGVTDRPIIQAILSIYFLNERAGEQLNLNPLLPKENESVGWLKVLQYCSSDEFKSVFTFNDFVIIQIDTDAHSEEGYDIEPQGNTEALISAVKQKIILSLGTELYADKMGQIIFAICVNQIECWLLPFFSTTPAHKRKEVNCINTLNRYVHPQFGYTLDINKGEGAFQYYPKIARELLKKKDFEKQYQENLSLKYFIDVELSKLVFPA
ncbi:MAG: hypothetical protein WKF91_21185 [Segetibacter sp.]